MGVAPLPKTERNKKIIADHSKGLGVLELVLKYQITPQRIYQIIAKAKTNPIVTQVLD
jgi:Mor family transcriptional regulator